MSHHANGDSQMSVSASTSDSVQIRFSSLGHVKVDDDVHRLHVDTASKEIAGNEAAAISLAKVVENAVAMSLDFL